MRRPTIVLLVVAGLFVVLAFSLRSRESQEPSVATTVIPTSVTTTPSMAPTTVVETTTTFPAGIAVCDLYGEVSVAGQVASSELVEASGLAASRTTPGVLWSHNDSRGTASLYAFDALGQDLGGYGVPGAFALDWEDMSPGPGPDGTDAYLYVGDIGDNFNIRGGLVTVYRVPDSDPELLEGEFPEATALTYRYPDGSHNAEALFIDPVEAALYLITKSDEAAFVFKGSLEPSTEAIDLAHISTLFLGAEVSAADMSADGSTLAVRGYRTVWMWHRNPGATVEDMLADEPCQAPSPEERQGEAIALDQDFAYWTISEGSNPDIHSVPRDR